MPRPLNIAMANLFGNATFSGGVPRAMLSRAQWLVRQGHSVDIYFQNLGSPLEPFESNGVRVWPVRGGRFSRHFAAANNYIVSALLIGRAFYSRHSRTPYDVVDLHDGGLFQGFKRFRGRSIGIAFTVHSSAMLNPEPRPTSIKEYNTRNELASAEGADLILPVSAYVSGPFRDRGYGSKCRVVYNCVPDDVEPAEPPSRALNAPIRLIFAARYAHNKGLDTVIEAMALAKNSASFQIRAFGEGPYAHEYREKIIANRLSERIHIGDNIAERDRLLAEYRSAHAFLLPTRYEAFSVALLEAFGLGLPAITTDIPPNLELTARTPLMFVPGDSAGLASVLDRIIEDAHMLTEERNRALQVAERFRADRVFPALVDAYRQLAE